VNGEDLHQFDLPRLKLEAAGTVRGVAIVAEGVVYMYSEDGDNYITALPFHVSFAFFAFSPVVLCFK